MSSKDHSFQPFASTSTQQRMPLPSSTIALTSLV
ncbi:hypothetical protein H257_15390 [Aphanomyces astaci]|uniref:Uncharacterized protein n=1 Tax=Aphanomyces astaci TaxID=112090 RepID=W4FPG3_APHAT|nr:hypothetical protein H257_15390 [Aphanomyces astaci]ETV68841.1 hypothetical protein H257_15390 [Aphanomyces astaci]|eukprot:XP_009841795.1 hypothetical protein H257_15390 [Aphanomyces astaci]